MKTAPAFIRVALLLLVIAGIGAWAWRSFGPERNASATSGPFRQDNPGPAAEAPAHQIVVTYFTTDQRCPTCLKIEKLTSEAMKSAFAQQLASGELRFETRNFDRDENKHFIKDYELSFKTVVISNRRNGKEVDWAKFDQVWDLVDEPEAFAACLQDGVRNLSSKSDG